MAKNNTKGKHKINPLLSSPASKKKIPPQTTKTDWQFRALAALLLVITFLLFVPSLSLHFVNWDDPDNLLENKTLQAFSYGWSWDAVKAIFTTDVIGNYNPLPILTFGIEKYFFAPDPVKAPFIFHFDNLWMHLLCTLFVYMLFTKMKLSRIAAFIGALLFGIHPMRVESVVWITERKDVLYGMFFLAALVTYTTCLQAERSDRKSTRLNSSHG